MPEPERKPGEPIRIDAQDARGESSVWVLNRRAPGIRPAWLPRHKARRPFGLAVRGARTGIILKKRRSRMIFIGGLVAFVVLAVLVRLLG